MAFYPAKPGERRPWLWTKNGNPGKLAPPFPAAYCYDNPLLMDEPGEIRMFDDSFADADLPMVSLLDKLYGTVLGAAKMHPRVPFLAVSLAGDPIHLKDTAAKMKFFSSLKPRA